MTKLLTKTLLRNAADLMTNDMYDTTAGEQYMCHALHAASGGSFAFNAPPAKANPVVQEFECLLWAHGVSSSGALHNDFFEVCDMEGYEKAALRFDFLNLLAESI